MKAKKTDIIMQGKIFTWLALATGLILLIPLIAMQFSEEIMWDFFDFAVMGVLLYGAGAIYVLLARKTGKNRLAIGIVLLALFLWVWAELAVGVFTNLGS